MTIQITPAELEARRESLATNGIVVTGDSGEINSNDCVIAYSYDGAILTLNVVSKPWNDPEWLVESRLAAFFQS